MPSTVFTTTLTELQIDTIRPDGTLARTSFPLANPPQQVNVATLRTKANAALTANGTFLALGAPTNADVLAQVKLLTRETNALIRLFLGSLDDVSDT